MLEDGKVDPKIVPFPSSSEIYFFLGVVLLICCKISAEKMRNICVDLLDYLQISVSDLNRRIGKRNLSRDMCSRWIDNIFHVFIEF